MFHYKYQDNKKIYQINKLIFDGQIALKRSSYIQDIIIPNESLLDPHNPNREYQYLRLVEQASFYNYPQICLNNCLGLMQKGQPTVTVPKRMDSIVDYATKQNQPITALQIRALQSLFKFGLAAYKIDIQNDIPLTELPKLNLIEGNKILDFKTFIDQNGIQKYKFILIDKTYRLFYQPTKIYIIKRRCQVCGIDQNGEYYQALLQNGRWNGFNLDRPWESDVVELVYPQYYGRLNFVPIVVFNPSTVRFNQTYNYQFTSAIQNLINLTLNIFQADSKLKSCYDMMACPTLFVYGSNAKPKDLTLGRYAINILRDNSARAEYANPSFSGIDSLKDSINTMKLDAQQQIFSILNAAGNSSGDALSIRLQASTLTLVAIVKNIGDAITNILQQLAIVVGENPDDCLYQPYLGFGNLQTSQQIKTETQEQLSQQEQPQQEQIENDQNLNENNQK